jgi:hypothetical protein
MQYTYIRIHYVEVNECRKNAAGFDQDRRSATQESAHRLSDSNRDRAGIVGQPDLVADRYPRTRRGSVLPP